MNHEMRIYERERREKESAKLTFRFDDVCINANEKHIIDLTHTIKQEFPDAGIMYAISPLIQDTGNERVFHKHLNAMSDFREYYKVDTCYNNYGMYLNYGIIASHGLIHCDHRLMAKSAQELSIISSCSLLKTDIFVPPFNKWNKDTEEICAEQGIRLIKWETGWRCIEHEVYDEKIDKWYLHARELTIEQVKQWINQK